MIMIKTLTILNNSTDYETRMSRTPDLSQKSAKIRI